MDYEAMWNKLKNDLRAVADNIDKEYRKLEPDDDYAVRLSVKEDAYRGIILSMKWREDDAKEKENGKRD